MDNSAPTIAARDQIRPTQAAASSPFRRLAIVVVTYKRQKMLNDLFDSFLALTQAPWKIVLVDNENSKATKELVDIYEKRFEAYWGPAEIDDAGTSTRVIYAPQTDNIGGSGGFSRGTALAYTHGAQWFWLMDDDVTVLPKALDRLEGWTDRFDVIQGSRLDFDGGAFYWQYQFITSLGIPNPVANANLGPAGYRAMNQLCFEGGLFSRHVVDIIGVPDGRYFIYGDDAVYGFLASKHVACAVVADLIIQRAREVSNWDIAGRRQLNSTSDTNRYYIMRNRAFTARYLQTTGDYHRFLYGLGTAATFCKELIRLIVVDHTFSTGIPALIRGICDGRKIHRDPSWKPMPPGVEPLTQPTE